MTERYPELGELSVGQVGPVYADHSTEPVAVQVELLLADATDVKMELVSTRIGGDGRFTGVPEPARITRLRGLSVQVSLATGELINVTPMAFAEDADRPDDITRVEYLDPTGQ